MIIESFILLLVTSIIILLLIAFISKKRKEYEEIDPPKIETEQIQPLDPKELEECIEQAKYAKYIDTFIEYMAVKYMENDIDKLRIEFNSYFYKKYENKDTEKNKNIDLKEDTNTEEDTNTDEDIDIKEKDLIVLDPKSFKLEKK